MRAPWQFWRVWVTVTQLAVVVLADGTWVIVSLSSPCQSWRYVTIDMTKFFVFLISSAAVRSGPWLPISSAPFPNRLWPLHAGIFTPIVLKTSATSPLLLYLVPSIWTVANCSALFDFSLFQLDHINLTISSQSNGFLLQYLPLVICFLSSSSLFLLSSVLFHLRPYIFFTTFLSIILSTFIASDKQI